jgi:hypothetical protein
VIVVFQILLIAFVLGAGATLLRGTAGARHQAIRRLLLLAFVGAAVLSIVFPQLLSRAATLFGIGRGTDLVLYGLVVAFLGVLATTARRFRELEMRLTRLARRLAIDEVPTPDTLRRARETGADR